jgi:hypothetical protein
METGKNALKGVTSSESQFEQGYQVPIQHLEHPGLQSDMKPQPATTEIPNEEGGYQTYRAAGKLQGKKAIITGGDSGIGRAIAILYAMEGADSLIVHLPTEESDAQETKRLVAKYGGKCTSLTVDLTSLENCQKVVDTALSSIGGINILVNNAAYQMVQNDISDLSYDQ